MLEAKYTPVDNYKSPAKLACGRQLQSIIPVSPNNLPIKSVDNDEFKQKRWGIKSKQKEYHDQHTNEQKILHTGETVQMIRDGKWKPAIVVEKLNEPRSYNVKTENGSMYMRNRKHLLKTESSEDQTIELSDEDEHKTMPVKSEDVTSDEERIVELDETKPEIRTKLGRISKRPMGGGQPSCF